MFIMVEALMLVGQTGKARGDWIWIRQDNLERPNIFVASVRIFSTSFRPVSVLPTIDIKLYTNNGGNRGESTNTKGWNYENQRCQVHVLARKRICPPRVTRRAQTLVIKRSKTFLRLPIRGTSSSILENFGFEKWIASTTQL